MTKTARYEKLLRDVYRMHGPRDNCGALVPFKTFAKKTRRQVGEEWDFSERHMMHRIAKAIVAEG